MKREEILKVFSVLGNYKSLGEKERLHYYEVPFWETPSFSPIYLNEDCKLEAQDLTDIENYFKKNTIKNPYIKQSPYCLLDIKSHKQKEQYEKICKQQGWYIEENPLYINILYKKIPFILSSKICFRIIDIENWTESYSLLLENGFMLNKQNIQDIKKIYKNKTFIVTICDTNNKLIGVGIISINGQVGFLTWGTINVEFRNQGYHNLLLAGCTMVAWSNGAKYCGYTTRNQHILDKRDSGLRMYICRKNGI